MKKIFIYLVIVFMLCISISKVTYAQPSPGDCDPDAEVGDPNYCPPVPLDGNILYIIIAGLAIGFYKLSIDAKRRCASVETACQKSSQSI